VTEPAGHVQEGVDPEPWGYGQPISILKSVRRGQSIAHALVKTVEDHSRTATVQWLRRTDERNRLPDRTCVSVWNSWPVKKRKGREECVESESDEESKSSSGDSSGDDSDSSGDQPAEGFPLKRVSWDGILDRIEEAYRAETPRGPFFCFRELPNVKQR
jgi:hypothetical protein